MKGCAQLDDTFPGETRAFGHTILLLVLHVLFLFIILHFTLCKKMYLDCL